MEDSIHEHMEETIKQRRHHARPVNVSHSDSKAGMVEKEWQRYHVIEKDKAETYNESETLSDERQHNVHKRGKSDEQDSLYVVMTSCEQAIQSSVHGKFASRTYSTGHANDNVAQRRMQENSEKEEQQQLKGKMEYEENYMPYLAMQLQEEGVDRDSKVEQNSYTNGRINLPFLSLHEDGRKGYHNLHNKRGDLNRRDLRTNSITERPFINQQRLSVGKPVRDYTHILNNKRVALPPPQASGQIVCAFGSSPVPKFQNSMMSHMPPFLASDGVHISRRTNLADGSLPSKDDNCVEKQTANNITTVAVQSGYMKVFPSSSSLESATDIKSNKRQSCCYGYTVLTSDKKEHEDVHQYMQIKHGSSFDVTLITTDPSCKCQFQGHQDYKLTVDKTKLHLSGNRTPGILCEWPYTAIRRISADHSKNLFQVEAGRKCSSGPGIFRFYTAESRTLYKSTMQAMTEAVKTHC